MPYANAGTAAGARPDPADGLRLEPAPLEVSDRPLPINLATALALADARPLVVAAAQASAWAAEAALQRAQVLWVPAFQIGAAYLRHDGVADFNRGRNPTQAVLEEWDFERQHILQNFNWFYAGFSFYQIVALSDAIFEPLAKRRVLNARRWDIQTAKNDALLTTAEVYFRVHRHRGTYAGALDAVRRCRDLVERIAGLSADLVPRVEADRARQLLADLEQRATLERQEWRVASADLTQVLRLDPSVVVVPLEPDQLQITLIDPASPLDDLVSVALKTRPEISAHAALIQAAEQRVRREQYRPLLPTVLFTGWQTPGGMRTQVGIFGTGPGHDFNQWSYRNDVSLQLVWKLEGLGFGNLARIKEQRGEASLATVKLFDAQDAVAAEVTRAQADVQSAAVRVLQAERAVRDGLITYNRNFEGLRQTQRFADMLEMVTRPQEAVVALEQVMAAYEAYFGTVFDYNRAQFELFHALGYPARTVAAVHRPGSVVPVETDRPFGLPPVGNGPPPTTH